MSNVSLLHTSLEVSKLCMGTMTFGSPVDPSEAQRMVDFCFDHEIHFFDTANVYHNGLSEQILGKCLGPKRSAVTVASKVRGAMGNPVEYEGLSRTAIRTALEASLRRLNTDYLDIYYLHQPDYKVPIEESLDAMEEFRKEGKIRYLAVSNYAAWQIAEMFSICRSNNIAPPRISQPMYNMIARGIEQEYLPFARRFEVGCICYNPLAGGLLTGKHHLDNGPQAGTRFENKMYQRRYWHPEYFTAVDALKTLAEQNGLTLPQLAFSWIMHQPAVTCVILGASSFTQLEQNFAAAQTPPLSPAILEECDRVWQQLRGPTPIYNR